MSEAYEFNRDDAIALLEVLAQTSNETFARGSEDLAEFLRAVVFATIGSLTNDDDERDQLVEYVVTFAMNDAERYS